MYLGIVQDKQGNVTESYLLSLVIPFKDILEPAQYGIFEKGYYDYLSADTSQKAIIYNVLYNELLTWKDPAYFKESWKQVTGYLPKTYDSYEGYWWPGFWEAFYNLQQKMHGIFTVSLILADRITAYEETKAKIDEYYGYTLIPERTLSEKNYDIERAQIMERALTAIILDITNRQNKLYDVYEPEFINLLTKYGIDIPVILVPRTKEIAIYEMYKSAIPESIEYLILNREIIADKIKKIEYKIEFDRGDIAVFTSQINAQYDIIQNPASTELQRYNAQLTITKIEDILNPIKISLENNIKILTEMRTKLFNADTNIAEIMPAAPIVPETEIEAVLSPEDNITAGAVVRNIQVSDISIEIADTPIITVPAVLDPVRIEPVTEDISVRRDTVPVITINDTVVSIPIGAEKKPFSAPVEEISVKKLLPIAITLMFIL